MTLLTTCLTERRGPYQGLARIRLDRKSTRLNSSHGYISYADLCLEKKNEPPKEPAGLHSATSRQPTYAQVSAPNEMLVYHLQESTASVASIMEKTSLPKHRPVSQI